MITVTKSALTRLVRIARRSDVHNILFSVKGGGCNGFKYNLEPMKIEPKTNDEVVPLHSNLSLVVDAHSIFHLVGTTIDWKDDSIMGSRFDFTNPNAATKCGCGSTFSIQN